MTHGSSQTNLYLSVYPSTDHMILPPLKPFDLLLCLQCSANWITFAGFFFFMFGLLDSSAGMLYFTHIETNFHEAVS